MLPTPILVTTRSLSSVLVLVTLCTTVASQVLWTQVQPPNSPSARLFAGLAYDRNRSCSVLFGGAVSTTTPWTNLNDTWEWDGNAWTQRSPATNPFARWAHAMAYDPHRGCTVLFGGVVSTASGRSYLNDTWEWDGTNWTARSPATRPAVRGGWQNMAYDAVRSRMVLFGGQGFARYDDTWEWDGTDWIQRFPATVPSERVWNTLAYDIGRDRVVMFGGWWSGTYRNETWEWDGNDWTQIFPATSPPSRWAHSMIYDPARGRVVTYGGRQSGTNLSDHWEWDGADWTQQFPVASAGNHAYHNLVYDADRRCTVLFGGAETWECYSMFPADFVQYGAGCPGSLGVPVLAAANHSLPWIGDPFTVELANLPAGCLPFMVFGFARESSPVPILPGCTQLASSQASTLLSASGSAAAWRWTIPADPAVVGVSLCCQGAVLLAGGPNPLGGALSNGGEATIGKRY